MIVENIDDDPQFAPRSVAPGESRAVAIAADLVTREVDVHQWTPMQPFFMPAGILDNMPNFQRGIMAALGRFSTELMDQLGRTRGSSQTDRDLEQARGFLNEQPNIWIWQPSVSSDAVGHLGAEVPRRPRQADCLQQAAGLGPGGVRAPRRTTCRP